MFNRVSILLSFVAMVVILAMMNFTTPTGVGPLGVLVFFTMIYIVFFGVINMIVAAFLKAAEKKQSIRKGHYYAATIAFGPIMLLLIQSFGSLNLFTITLVAIFIFLGCFVIKKRFQ